MEANCRNKWNRYHLFSTQDSFHSYCIFLKKKSSNNRNITFWIVYYNHHHNKMRFLQVWLILHALHSLHHCTVPSQMVIGTYTQDYLFKCPTDKPNLYLSVPSFYFKKVSYRKNASISELVLIIHTYFLQ